MKNENCYVFCKREDALHAFNKIEATIRDHGKASAADLYKILCVPADSDDATVGWTTTDGFIIERYRDGNFGWVLKYPAPKPFKSEALKTALNRIKHTSVISANGCCIYGEDTMKTDMVNHPSHYQSDSGLEVIDVIEAFTKELKGAEAFCVANAIKYLCRFDKKNGVEDLEKAEWYIKRAIKYRKKHERKSNKTSAVSYAETDADNTADMYKKMMRDDDFGGEVMSVIRVPNKPNNSDVEIITNIAELNHYSAMVKDFENKYLLVSFKTKAESDAFVNKIKSSIDETAKFTIRDLSMLCFNFSEEVAFDVTNHYCDARPDTSLWTSAHDVNIDDIYTHEDGSVTLAIEYPVIHTNKED